MIRFVLIFLSDNSDGIMADMLEESWVARELRLFLAVSAERRV